MRGIGGVVRPGAVGRAAVAAALLSVVAACAEAGPASAQEPPPLPTYDYDGAIETGLLLRRLGQTARVPHIAAHPDDENTALLSTLALGSGVDVAYLSITRGEGGQNGIGPELGTALGIIRSEELLAARRLDGATQYFTRAIDFGFSKNAEETFTHWPRDSVLADMVAVIRHFRPDVVVSVWSGTRRDGHGQHEASGLLARESVLAAADPARFPEQIEAGLPVHTVSHYYWSARYGADGPDVQLNTGRLDPLLGRSYHQVAMASRSLHRSQDMGAPQAPGPRRTAFDRVDPADPPEVAMSGSGRPPRQLEGAATRVRSLLTGTDTLLSQRAATLGLDQAAGLFDRYERTVAQTTSRPWGLPEAGAGSLLMRARVILDSANAVVDATGGSADPADLADLRYHVAAEAADLAAAALAASNVRVDAVASTELLVPWSRFELELSIWDGSMGVLGRAEPILPEGWEATLVEVRGAGGVRPAADDLVEVRQGERVVWRYSVQVPVDAKPTQPYFLAEGDAGDGALYAGTSGGVPGAPFRNAPVRARFTVDSPVAPGFAVERDASFVGVDARQGEFRRPIRVVPWASVRLSPSLSAIPVHLDRSVEFAATVRADGASGIEGRLRPAAPDGWTVEPSAVDVSLAAAGVERTVRFRVTPPAGVAPGEYPVGVLFEGPGCRGEIAACAAIETYAHGYEVIDYPHIATHHLYEPATAGVRVLDVRVADVSVGYVEGVPDGVPQALDDLGVMWEPLDESDLADGDLSRFDVVITGTRAYELRPDLVAHNQRLLEWTRGGGTLISLYNKYPALAGSYAPWSVTIARPHGRVTDERAPVTVLEPDHPLLDTPNRIGPADWDGWVQERGLYFWESWDGPLTPLLAMNDPGEAPLTGSLLVGPLGEGLYVHNALALFRQLPAGVPGAYRLLANMVSLGADE